MFTDKKALERYFLDRFLSLFEPQLQGSIESTEEPDFLFRGPHGCIGIEITELHRARSDAGRPLQADQAMRQRVVERVKILYDLVGNPPVNVSLFFNEHHPIQKNRVNELAKLIVALVLRNIPGSGKLIREEYDWDNRDYFPEDLHEISVYSLAQTTHSFFTAPSTTWIPNLMPDDIQRVLDAKEVKCNAYRARSDTIWLVINCDGSFMSTWFDLDNETIASTFRSSFDRVFLVRDIANSLHELSV